VSSRPEWPVFSLAPQFGAPATQWRDRGNQSYIRTIDVIDAGFLISDL